MIVFGIAFGISFITKFLLHIYLADRNNNKIVASGAAASIEIFWFYTKPVTDEYKRLKKICNFLHVYNLIYFFAEFAILTIKTVNKF
ncbi:MAG: hypothetical protein HEQ40_14510 [Lacibacter sp.]|jgi:hypothetical protein